MGKNITKAKHRFPLKQIRRIPRFFRLHWPPLALLFITFSLAFLNYEPGTYLLGWDNLNPEFSPLMNLKRALFSVWQEHRGLGLLAGQAHSADLPRILLVLLLDYLKTPLHLVRYITTFLPLIIGPLGVYYLFYKHLFREKLDAKSTQFASFLGALYYLLNLNTIQTFFIPFETFTWFYGSLPWLIYFLISYISKPSISKLTSLFVVSLISAPSFFVETIYLVFFVSILPFFIEFFTQKRKLLHTVSAVASILLSLIVPHLFWLLPVIFFVFTGAHVAENAHINVISSPETYYRNLEFATLKDLALLKGYLFNYLDMGANFKYDYLLSVWRSHIDTPMVAIIGYSSFVVILIGLYYSLKKKFDWTASFLSVLGVSFFFLLGGGLLINEAIPLVGELFRSPFTKFSIPLSLAYSFFFAVGTIFILDLFTYLHSRLTYSLTVFTISILLILYMSPAFSGNLIGNNMRVQLPQEYLDLFAFFKSEPQSGRIANFPQYTFWGWNYYDWGYRGSGFLWHGLSQPLMDRAFDVWDKSSERYYEDISTAIYSNNSIEFDSLIDRYAISWIIIDKHIVSPDGKTDLGLTTLENFLNSSKYTFERNFNDNILIYKVSESDRYANSISVEHPIDSINPLADLSLRPTTNWIEKAKHLSLAVSLPSQTDSSPYSYIHIPSLSETEDQIPVKVEYLKSADRVNLRLSPQTPIIFAGEEQINITSDPLYISFSVPPEDSFVLQVEDRYFLLQLPAELDHTSAFIPLATTYVPLSKDFDVSVYSISQANFITLTNELSQAPPAQCYTSKPNRQLEKIISPDGISLIGTDMNGCLSVPIPEVPIDTLLSYSFTYSSPSLTTGNVNITDSNYNSKTTALPLEPSSSPKKTTMFTHSTGQYQQLNLILEAEGTKSVQEITFDDITLSTHPLIYSTSAHLNHISEISLTTDSPFDRIQVSLPITDTEYDILQTSQGNSLFPENRNCDQYSDGDTVKIIRDEGFFYQSKNAVQCDYLNLRHLPHSLNYLLSFTAKNISGLPLTVCLENYQTRRCDIQERFIVSDLIQHIINPIANPDNPPGYTLHLFNQSIGNHITTNLLQSISVRPIPYQFIKNISVSKQAPQSESPSSDIEVNTSHHSEYLSTLTLNTKNISDTDPLTLNFYQTHSPYWKAVSIPNSLISGSSFKLNQYLFLRPTQGLTQNTGHWYNAWTLPTSSNNTQHIAIFYLPQILEFIGLTFLGFTLTGLITITLFSRHKKDPQD